VNGLLTLAATGAPLAARTVDLANSLTGAGWTVEVATTAAARAWTDNLNLESAIGSAVRIEQRHPSAGKSNGPSDVVVVCPATFNTVAKIATGIADSYVHSMLCEAVSRRVPLLMVPMVKESLWNHPAWSNHLRVLENAGVWFLDPSSGAEIATPVASGSGDRLTALFDPNWIVSSLRRRGLRLP